MDMKYKVWPDEGTRGKVVVALLHLKGFILCMVAHFTTFCLVRL